MASAKGLASCSTRPSATTRPPLRHPLRRGVADRAHSGPRGHGRTC
uniref:Uncharacterized protein n=1 Tax=Arundo donax TaxID=35708 RepID=A0A0A8ZZC0_ARUDO